MPIDFSKFKAPPKEQRPIDPIAIFQRLRVTDSSINDLWLAQGDALRGWHTKRIEKDVAISLNTGAGKTLVGLLIGQSLVNENRSMVLYACSSIQLVLQTRKKAEGYGLPITTYVRGEFSNDLSAKGDAVCLTTYQALFNGKSKFFNREITGIVFDDAHAAEHLLREHFSLRISKARFEQVYSAIANEFADYFYAVGFATSFNEVISGTGNRLLFAPPFEVRRAHAGILKSLHDSPVADDETTTFAWEYLKDRIDLCAFILSSYSRSEQWADLAKPPQRDTATETIENFKQAKGPEKLVLAGRYDGMDLPGDICRVVVIDDLPSGIGPLERFLWEYLKFSNTLRSAIASRVVQSFGRISRGMSDHGVALITGRGLVDWLQVPKNLGSLPRFLQKQLQLGFQMSAGLSAANIPELFKGCLERQRDWVDTYERYMQEADHEADTQEPPTAAELALAESKFAADLWHRDFETLTPPRHTCKKRWTTLASLAPARLAGISCGLATH